MDGGVAVQQQHPAVTEPGFFHMPKIELPKYQRAASHIPFHVQKYPLSAIGNMVTPTQPPAQPVMPDARTPQPAPGDAANADPSSVLFDGKRMRKAVIRKTVDYNSAVTRYIENRVWQRDGRDHRAIQPDTLYELYMNPPLNMLEKPMNCLTTKFMRQSTNKFRCPIFALAWTPEGRRLVTGASSGEFTLWNGLTFNFETILQAHESSVRAMRWSHNDQWMITADHAGFIKYWQSNMNNVKMYQGHKEPIRCLSFCPTDAKFASSSDDGTVRIWDFLRCHEEKILRGHGADVKCVDWHPQKSLVASGSKDNQVPIKLWDPKSGASLATLHAHKFTVMDLKWSKNGLWLLTASRDHLVKLFDVRNMKEEVQVFKGHKKEATAVAWHPINETIFCSGGSDGSIMFWQAGTEKELGSMEEAHDAIIWDLAWHPLGHILSSASNDHSTKFWTRNRPGDTMRDKYNLNTLPVGPDGEVIEEDLEPSSSNTLLPGMGLEHGLPPVEEEKPKKKAEDELPSIPGLDWSSDMQYLKEQSLRDMPQKKKMPFARPIPKCFEQAWISNQQPGLLVKEEDEEEGGGKGKKRDRKVKRSKIKSLLSLSLPDRPPPGLQNVDLSEFDESGGPPQKSEPPFNVGQLPPELHLQPPPEEMPPGLLGNAPTSEYGDDIDFRFARDVPPGGMDQDYRADQDYRGDQDLRTDSDFRLDQDIRGQNEPMQDNFRGPNHSVQDGFRDSFNDSRDSFRASDDRQRESLRDLYEPPKVEFRNLNDSPRGRGRGHGGFMGQRGDRRGLQGDRPSSSEERQFEPMEHDDFNVSKTFDQNTNESFGYSNQNMSGDSFIEPHEMMAYENRHSPSPGPGFRGHDQGRNDSFRGGGNKAFHGGRGGADSFRGGRGRGDSFRGGTISRGGGDSFRGGRNRNDLSRNDSDSFRGGDGQEGDMGGSNFRGDNFGGDGVSNFRDDRDNFRGNQGREGQGAGGIDQDRGVKRSRDDSLERGSWGGDMGNDKFGNDSPRNSGPGVSGMGGGFSDNQGDSGRAGFQGRGWGGRMDQGDGGARGGFQGRGGSRGGGRDQGDSGRGGFQGRGGRGGGRGDQGGGGRGGFQGRGGRGGGRDDQGDGGRGGFQGRGGRGGGSRDDQGGGGRGGFQGRGGRGGFRGGGRGDGGGRGQGGPRGRGGRGGNRN